MRDVRLPIKTSDFTPHPDDRRAVWALEGVRARFQVNRKGRVYGVCMGHCGDGASLSWLASLPMLVSYAVAELTGARRWFSDAELSRVCAVRSIKAIGVCNCEQVTASGVFRLGAHDHIRWLTLPSCAVDDRGVRDISKLRRLLKLSLVGSPASDESLMSLGNLEELRSLHLGDTAASSQTIEQLASSLLRCRIYRPDRTEVPPRPRG